MEKDHLEILLEDMNGKFDLLLEGHQGLRNEITRTREELCEKIDLNTARIEFVKEELISAKEELGARIDSVENNLGARIDSVENNLGERIDSVENNLNARIDSVEKNLGERIDSVENNLNERIDSVENNLGERIDSVEKNLGEKVDQNTIRIEALDDKIDAVATDLKAHRADTEAHHGIYRVQELKKD